jgi:hypothetical protein
MKYKPSLILIPCVSLLGACSPKSDKPIKTLSANELVPEHYTETQENVIFDLTPEVPNHIDITAIPKIKVLSQQSSNLPLALCSFASNKNVEKKVFIPGHSQDEVYWLPDSYEYRFDDDSYLYAGGFNATFDSGYGAYYAQMFDKLSWTQNPVPLPFASIETALKKITYAIDSFAYGTDVSLQCIPLPASKAQEFEQAMPVDSNKNFYKTNWTEEDDAYIFCGTQQICGLPIYDEMRLIGQVMAIDDPLNAPIHGVYTTRGVEWISMSFQYAYIQSDEEFSILPFQDIAQVISKKLNYILSDKPYRVYRAKLYYMVRLGTELSYLSEPIWYFEVDDPQNNKRPLIVLVSAVTGKEIPVA